MPGHDITGPRLYSLQRGSSTVLGAGRRPQEKRPHHRPMPPYWVPR